MSKRATPEDYVEAAIRACERTGVDLIAAEFEITPRGAQRFNVQWSTPYDTTASWSLAVRGLSTERCERYLVDAIQARAVPAHIDVTSAAERACRRAKVTLCEAASLPDYGARVVWVYADGTQASVRWCVGHVTERECERDVYEAICARRMSL